MRRAPLALLQVASDTAALRACLGKSRQAALTVRLSGLVAADGRGDRYALAYALEALRALYGADGPESDEQALHHLNRKFAADLRAGEYDEPSANRKSVAKLLREDVVARLAEDNPRYEI